MAKISARGETKIAAWETGAGDERVRYTFAAKDRESQGRMLRQWALDGKLRPPTVQFQKLTLAQAEAFATRIGAVRI